MTLLTMWLAGATLHLMSLPTPAHAHGVVFDTPGDRLSRDAPGAALLSRSTEPEDGARAKLAWLARRQPRQELADARRKWASQAIDEYEFTFQRRCFCDPEFTRPVTIKVRENRGVLMTSVDERARPSFERYNTIEKLFDFVEAALNRNAFDLDVTYDEAFGYPRSVAVDYDYMMKDEEMSFRVTDFRVIGKREAGAAATPQPQITGG